MNTVFGGQVLQAHVEDGEPLMYLSPTYTNGEITSPARGGLPVLFPQFANLGPGRKHGFARNVQWAALSERHYQLRITPNVYDNWPHSAQIDVVWQVIGNTFQVTLTVENTGISKFDWTGGLHPYWLVPDLLQCRLTGLSAEVEWTGLPYEQLFDAGADLALHCNGYVLELQSTGFTQWMVWNPGREGAKDLDDMPHQDWQRFVCIEPVCASTPEMLHPNQTFTGTLKVKRVAALPP
jgi:glucose-6-phosphate 1-epimerase